MLQNRVDNSNSAPPLAKDFGDKDKLAAELKAAIQGEVRFDNGSRALYATDASNYRQVPIGVVIPRTVDDVVETVRLCYRYGVPVLSRGGGTSLCGQCCNVAVVIDFSKYLNKIVEIDKERKIARVQPGVVLDDLRDQANEVGLTFAPDPATHNHNTLGGMIGNNSCGPHSVMGGTTVENVIELDVLTYDGLRLRVGATDEAQLQQALNDSNPRKASIYRELLELRDRYADAMQRRYPDIPRRVSGYNLRALLPERGFHVAQALVGTEGTCVVVLEATLRLVDHPAYQAMVVLGYPNVYEAADHVPEVMGYKPTAMEGMDDLLVSDMRANHLHVDYVKLLPEGKGWLIVEFGGASQEEANANAKHMIDSLCRKDSPPSVAFFDDYLHQHQVWKIRESGLGATAHVPNQPLTWEGWEDSAVPPERLGEYLRKLRALYDKYGYQGDFYGHFGQGCLHTRINFNLETVSGIQKHREFVHEAAHLVTDMGGSISGEHGDGQSKAELLPIMFGPEIMQAFRDFKGIWDPHWRMNPGKVVGAAAIDENLRLGTDYDPPEIPVRFAYAPDAGDFPRTTLRCVGVGECRKKSGTMCPSYMATMEEKHSTRGRAHLLFEMVQGEVIRDGWKSEAVHEALDLCLSCKGCKNECPVSVDMATYKAEFMSHYYEGRMRPIAAYAFGMIDRWAKLGSIAPSFVNLMTQHESIAGVLKRIAGIAPQRRITPMADESFTAWFRKRSTQAGGPKIILWPDTFCNYFQPDILKAAAEVLEHAGYAVTIPEGHLCCGRPLYEHGMLDRAKGYLGQVMERLDADIRAGTPVVGMEPACVSVFRDELTNLFPHSEQAKRLSEQSFLFSEFIAGHAEKFALPPLRREAVVHGHCHQKSVLDMNAEKCVLSNLELNYRVLDSGCCGMAGSFGFEKEKYDVSITCGERVLLPEVRAASEDTLILANGFSCREQIVQTTGRQPLHLSQVLRMALRQGG